MDTKIRRIDPTADRHRLSQLEMLVPCPINTMAFVVRYGRFARALKNSQLSPGESHVIYGTGHKNGWELLTGLGFGGQVL